MISIKKHIEFSNIEVQEILNGLPTKILADECVSRDARFVVNQLTEIQKLDLFYTLISEKNLTTEIDDELDRIAVKRASNLRLRDMIKKEGLVHTLDATLNNYSMREIVTTLATFISE